MILDQIGNRSLQRGQVLLELTSCKPLIVLGLELLESGHSLREVLFEELVIIKRHYGLSADEHLLNGRDNPLIVYLHDALLNETTVSHVDLCGSTPGAVIVLKAGVLLVLGL